MNWIDSLYHLLSSMSIPPARSLDRLGKGAWQELPKDKTVRMENRPQSGLASPRPLGPSAFPDVGPLPAADRARANEVKHERKRKRKRGNPISLKRVPAGPLTWPGREGGREGECMAVASFFPHGR